MRYRAVAVLWGLAGIASAHFLFLVPHSGGVAFDATMTTVPTATRFGTLPEATSSFGAVTSDGWLYVYGGHIAVTHDYSLAAVSGRFARMRLGGEARWEQLPGGPGLQGMNLAVYGGKIYRIGGMEPRNPPGSPEATYSVADCARFDPASMKWESLPPLPAPRSSHDVVVVGSKLIVVGGWTLKGPDHTEWLNTIEILDLSAPKLEWKSAPQPFERRALVAAAYNGKMYVMGGFDERARIIRQTDIFDPESGSWTKGPELPAGEANGFSSAACVHHGDLYVSVADGSVYKLNMGSWQKSAVATPRIAHRMISTDGKILILGGAAKGKNSDLMEAVAL
jgi:N-acetylneuraminic acid mutarotase